MRPLLRALALCLLAAVAAALPERGAAQSRVAVDPDSTLLRIDPIIVPRFHDGQVTQHVTFLLLVNLSSKGAKSRAEALQPRLTDAFVRDIYAVASRTRADQDVDLMLVKQRLAAVSARLLGESAVKEILIERVMTRRFG